MKCQECNKNPASVHFTQITNGQKSEVYLCETCMKDKEDTSFLSMNPLLASLLHHETFYAGQKPRYQQEAVLQCPSCQMTYQQFVKVGKFGCSKCYETFDKQLKTVLGRIHNTGAVHVGKIPHRIGGTIHLQREIRKLREQLAEEVAKEAFELAVKTRDALRELEAQVEVKKHDQ